MDKRSVSAGAAAHPVRFSLLPGGLKEKLIVGFSLMSVIPLLTLGYVVSVYVFPRIREISNVSLIAALATGIALLGFAVTRRFVVQVIRLSAEAQAIARGELDRKVEVGASDEVGSIGSALNQITQRVRDNMSQLHAYGEQTKHLNLEINRKILTLSHLLQISNLIGQSAKIDEVRGFILEKMAQLEGVELNCLLELDAEEGVFKVGGCSGSSAAQAQEVCISSPWLEKVLREGRMLVVDREHPSPQGLDFLSGQWGMTNALLQPVLSMQRGVAVLVSANRGPGFVFQEDTLDLLKVFGKQMAIAIENDLLAKRAEELRIMDELTGVYNASFMKGRLEEEVRRAVRYQRSCSLIVLNLDDFQRVQDRYGVLAGEGVLHQVAEILKRQVTEVDRVGRMGQDEFAIILPEKTKREAIDLAESIRRTLEAARFTNGPAPLPGFLTVCAGVSENPLDGSSEGELFAKAGEAMRTAKRQGKNRVLAALGRAG